MPKSKQLSKPRYWHEKTTYTTFMTISHWKTKNPRTKKTPWLKKMIFILLILIVGMATHLAKLWVSFLKNILIYRKKVSKTNLFTPGWLVVMLLLSKKAISKVIRPQARSNNILVTKMTTMSVSGLTKSQKTSDGLDNLRINDWRL